MGFHDFAGSAVIHFVGGLTALIGAKLLGPRIGKFNKDGSPNGIPGHSLTVGALGVFILWFGWYGFNGAAAATVSAPELSVAEAVPTVAVNGEGDYSLVIAPVVADLCTTPVALSAPPNSYQNNSQS